MSWVRNDNLVGAYHERRSNERASSQRRRRAALFSRGRRFPMLNVDGNTRQGNPRALVFFRGYRSPHNRDWNFDHRMGDPSSGLTFHLLQAGRTDASS